MKSHRILVLATTMIAVLGISACSKNEESATWPTKPVRMVIPFPAGGSTDAVGRLIAERLSQKLGQQFVVDNRPGAAGNIGTDQVVKSEADGYTITLTTSGPLANNKFLYSSMPFDAEKDLAPIVLVGQIPLLIAANEKVNAQDLKQFIALAKAAPGKYAMGNPGNGTIGHLAFELLKRSADVDLQGIPYKGDTPILTDLIGGSIQGMVAPITAFIPHVQAGKIKGLAVTSDKRFPGTPDVPTAAEQGVDMQASVWFAVAGPAGMPRPIIDKLNREINVVLESPEGRTALEQIGSVGGGGTPEELGSLMKAESAKWKTIIEAANIRLD